MEDETDAFIRKEVRKAWLYNPGGIAATVVTALMVYVMAPRVTTVNTTGFSSLVLVLGIAGVIAIIAGFILPRVYRKLGRLNKESLLNLYHNRCLLFYIVSMFAFFMGFTGIIWQITAVFLIVSAVSALLIFPTENRWKRMLEIISDSQAHLP